jgi:DNA processing protein
VVVVEALERSGALECRGSNRLLAEGAGVLWDVDGFLEAVCGLGEPLDGTRDRKVAVAPVLPDPPDGLPEREAEVPRGVDFRSAGADVVAERIGVEMRAALGLLAMLELRGYVVRDAAGTFARRTAP